MAKARVSTNPLYNGGAGGYTFYTRDGEQIIRQRKNNSNYGESASRSQAQQLRRVRWSNLVNLYKAMKSWQPKAYESKRQGQTDYNIFMSLNINSSVVGLTKSMALQGCAVVEPLMVSRGSLPKIGRAALASSGAFDTDIVLSQAITSATTIAELSADIIANNPQWLDGDNLAMALYIQTGGDGVDPYVACRYTEVTLDTTNTALLSTLDYGSRLARIQSGTQGAYNLNFTYDLTANEVGIAFIHTRKVSGGLQVSNSTIQLNGDYIWDQYSGQQWLLQCAATYGIDELVPLDPGTGGGGSTTIVDLLSVGSVVDLYLGNNGVMQAQTGTSRIITGYEFAGAQVQITAGISDAMIGFFDNINVGDGSEASLYEMIAPGASRTFTVPTGTKAIVLRGVYTSSGGDHFPEAASLIIG